MSVGSHQRPMLFLIKTSPSPPYYPPVWFVLYSYSAPTMWNSVPQSLRSCESLTTFRKHLKTLYFQLSFLPPPSDPLPSTADSTSWFWHFSLLTYLLTYLQYDTEIALKNWHDLPVYENEKRKKRKKDDNEADSPKNKPVMGKIGIDKSKELKLTEEENDL